MSDILHFTVGTKYLSLDGGLLADGGPAPAHHLHDADGAAAAAGGHVHRCG